MRYLFAIAVCLLAGCQLLPSQTSTAPATTLEIGASNILRSAVQMKGALAAGGICGAQLPPVPDMAAACPQLPYTGTAPTESDLAAGNLQCFNIGLMNELYALAQRYQTTLCGVAKPAATVAAPVVPTK